ncbi:MAG: T9SS type A sorting domain-containing protein [Lewinellaceae bacterium]|nr:T9SS type A sorting domain-containing protein [Lewinellaceae bacterium]
MSKTFYLYLIAFFSLLQGVSFAQNFEHRTFIAVTDTIEEDGVVFAASSDDAEQVNDELDGLYDDDLDAGWEGAPEDQIINNTGLRFRNIYIPQGAKIDSAFLILHSHEGKSAEDVAKITIAGEASDNALTFNEVDLITARPRTAATLLWEVAEEWELWQPYRTPDLKNVVQEIVNRSGWVPGNALALFFLGENQGVTDVENAREFESFENISDPEDGGDGQNHPERRPELVIYFSVDNARFEVPIAVTDTITEDDVTFEASSDDAEQVNDEFDSLYDDDLDAGWEGAPEDQIINITGLRFRHIFIPRNAVIDSAYIQVWSHEGKSADDVAKITISAEAADNAQTFTETALISDRPRTAAKLLWEVAEEWELWGKYQTPDLKELVQEVVNRGGWAPGNAIAFIMEGENQGVTDVENAREFESYENISDPEDGGDGQNHPERRPRLVVYYSSQSTSIHDIFSPSAKSLKVYPNPALPGNINLELESDDAATTRLFDVQGRLIKTMLSSWGKNIVFQTGNLPTGTYFIQTLQGKEVYVQKLVIGQ